MCTIAYADTSAQDALAAIEGWTVTVRPSASADSAPFDAQVGPTHRGDDGQLKLTLYPWDEQADQADRSEPVVVDAFDDIDRLEVIGG